MKNLLYFVAVILLSILCPLSWVTTSMVTEPAWLGEFVTNNLTEVRTVLSILLAALLFYSILGPGLTASTRTRVTSGIE